MEWVASQGADRRNHQGAYASLIVETVNTTLSHQKKVNNVLKKIYENMYMLFMGSTPRGGRGFFHVCALWQYTCLTLLPTVRWRYRRHVAQLCCWRLATLTGRGGGGDDNVPFDCKMTLPKTRCPTLLLTSCYLDREGGWGGMITFLSTVRWRYRRHVAQLCCWRLATLTGKGGGGGDDNVPFDCKMTLPKTRCPTLLLTSCHLDREGGWGGDDNVPFDCKMTLPKTW